MFQVYNKVISYTYITFKIIFHYPLLQDRKMVQVLLESVSPGLTF